MGLISRILANVDVSATSLSIWSLAAPWGVDIRNFPAGYILLVAQGCAFYRHGEQEPKPLAAGQMIFVPNGADCRLLSAPNASWVDLRHLPWTAGPTLTSLNRLSQPDSPMSFTLAGSGEATVIYGLAFSLEGASTGLLFPQLPELTVFTEPPLGLATTLPIQIENIDRAEYPGYSAIARPLVEHAVLVLLRELLLDSTVEGNRLAAALQHKQLFRLVTAIHERANAKWSLAHMAEYASMSRASLSRVFQQVMGQSPNQYLLAVRIATVQQRLANSSDPIEVLAAECGFNSSRALRQHFRAVTGLSPSAYRKQVQVER